eukprot:TRINITY_DN1744_c0_g2_i2.p1 TRINITY_DN1744_c0_g2~~TRINITY_DN1744_c0_g2_i2.p1  ORF type:complete len:467 (+),score=65.13 TRINITY_DN1744_c0_g2_i2:2145-3545(+)
MSAFSRLKRFLFAHKYWVYANSGGRHTHTLLDGGKFAIPDDRLDAYHKELASIIDSGEHVYPVELKTSPLFQFFADIDFTIRLPWQGEETLQRIETIIADIDRLVSITNGCIGEFFEGLPDKCRLVDCRPFNDVVAKEVTDIDPRLADERFSCELVSNLPKRSKSSPPVGSPVGTAPPMLEFKLGSHPFAIGLNVSKQTCLLFRTYVLQCFQRHFGSSVFHGMSFDKVFDACIYDANGIRPCGSRKAIKCCTYSDKKRSEPCQAGCVGGYIDKGRPYRPVNVYDRDGNRDEQLLQTFLQNTFELLRQTSIRIKQADAAAATRIRPEFAPDEKTPQRIRIRGSPTKSPQTPVPKTPRSTTVEKHVMAQDSDAFKRLQRFVALTYEGAQIKSVTWMVSKKKQRVYDVHTKQGSVRCFNKNAVHRQQNVYFVVTRNGIWQQCWDRDSCKDFRSPIQTLDPILLGMLFNE